MWLSVVRRNLNAGRISGDLLFTMTYNKIKDLVKDCC